MACCATARRCPRGERDSEILTCCSSGRHLHGLPLVLLPQDIAYAWSTAQLTHCHLRRVGAETLLQEYGVKVDPEEFRAFAGMGEAHFLRGVASKHGVVIQDIDGLKKIYYDIYLAKVAQSGESIGLPGVRQLLAERKLAACAQPKDELHIRRLAALAHL